MKFVLDSSVALKTVLPERESNLAIRLIGDFERGLHQLLAPDVFPVELGHALTRAERQQRIQPPDGWRLWNAIMANSPELHPSIMLMPRAFEMSSRLRIGIYDCLYAALAEREQCQLVTADQRIVALFPAHAVALDAV